MSESRQPSPPPRERPAAGGMLPALMAAVYGAALVATWGLTSLALDADVIEVPNAGPLLGPAIAAAAILSTLACLRRLPSSRVWLVALLAAASSWCVMLIVGGLGSTLVTGQVIGILLFAGRHAASPFLLLPALLAGVAVVISSVLAAASPTARSFDRR